MKSPCIKRAAMRIAMLWVAAQTRLVAVITVPPARSMGLIGYWSARIPKGRLAKAMPKMTMDTEREAVLASTANSSWITGSTGGGIKTVGKAAATRENTTTCIVALDDVFIVIERSRRILPRH